MQIQNKRGGINIDLGPFSNIYEFIPRIEYMNLILSEAQWNLKNSNIKRLLDLKTNKKELLLEIEEFRSIRKIPVFVLLVDGDNELLINLKNFLSIKMFLDTVKNRSNFKIKEFLYEKNGTVKENNSNNYYTNQITLSFYNSKKIENAQ